MQSSQIPDNPRLLRFESALRFHRLVAVEARTPRILALIQELMMNPWNRFANGKRDAIISAVWFLTLSLTPMALADVRWTSSADDAFRESQRLAMPVLVLGVSPQCAPCQRMKATFHQEPAYRSLLEQVVVLELQAESPQFSQFLTRHPEGFKGTVPMVYLLTPEDSLHFVRSGTPSLEELRTQIGSVPVGKSVADRLRDAAKARSRTEMVDSLQWIHQYQESALVSNSDPQIARLRQVLVSRMSAYLQSLESGLRDGKDVYRAAFRTTELYLQIANYPELQNEARRILVTYRKNEPTRIPIYQSMHVVRARIAEQRKDAQFAIAWYLRAQGLRPDSPLGQFAAMRLEALRAPETSNLASQGQALQTRSLPRTGIVNAAN